MVALLRPAEVPKDLICAICLSVPLDPCILEPCQHVFCQDCAKSCLSNRRQAPMCPIDRAPCSLPKPLEPGFVHRVWCSVIVTCGDETNSGCAWTGSIADYSKHKENCCCITKDTNIQETQKELELLKESNQKQKEEIQKLQLQVLKIRQENRDEIRQLNEDLCLAAMEWNAQRQQFYQQLQELHNKIYSLEKERKKLQITNDTLTAGLQTQKTAHEKHVERLQTQANQTQELQKKQIERLQRQLTVKKQDNLNQSTSTTNAKQDLKTISDGLSGRKPRQTPVTALAAIISQDLEDLPEYLDANRIYGCVQKIYMDFQKKRICDDPADLYECDVKLLLAVCGASTWFNARQWRNIDRWYKESWGVSVD